MSFLGIKLILCGLGVLFTLTSAIFAYCEVRNGSRRTSVRVWFQSKWDAVDASPCLRLPENVIRWILRARSRFLNPFRRVGRHKWFLEGLITITFALLSSGCWILWGIKIAIPAAVITLPLLLEVYSMRTSAVLNRLPNYLLSPYALVFYAAGAVLWMKIVLGLDVCLATLAMIPLSLVFWAMIMMPIAGLFVIWEVHITGKRRERYVFDIMAFCGAVSLSFLVTLLAFCAGRISSPLASVPKTFQMLMSNVLFDGLTLVVTLRILSWAIAESGLWRIPFAVVMDIVVAAVLACGSLYLGLVRTPDSLCIVSVFHVLIGRSADGNHTELGPYFFAMHTTFLPTCAYLLLILATWVAKALLVPVHKFFGAAEKHDRPLALTAALFGIIAAIFGVSVWMVDVGEEWLRKRQEGRIEQSVVPVSRAVLRLATTSGVMDRPPCMLDTPPYDGTT